MEDFYPQDIVDFRREFHTIKQKFGPRYYCEEQAAQEAARLWGAHCNVHGVLDQVTEQIRVEHKRYSAAIRLYETAKSYWHISLGFTTPDFGFATPATVWTKRPSSADLRPVDRLSNNCCNIATRGSIPAIRMPT
jgi:hypothetical protein